MKSFFAVALNLLFGSIVYAEIGIIASDEANRSIHSADPANCPVVLDTRGG